MGIQLQPGVCLDGAPCRYAALAWTRAAPTPGLVAVFGYFVNTMIERGPLVVVVRYICAVSWLLPWSFYCAFYTLRIVRLEHGRG